MRDTERRQAGGLGVSPSFPPVGGGEGLSRCGMKR